MPSSFEEAQHELLMQIALLYEDKLCTDLEVICRKQAFQAHKAILSGRSPVLRKALDHQWREGHKARLVLSDDERTIHEENDASDDPVAVRMMIDYMYKADFDPGQDPYGIFNTLSDHGPAEPSDDTGLCKLRDAHPSIEDRHTSHSTDRDATSTVSDLASVEAGKLLDQSVSDGKGIVSMKNDILTLYAHVYALGDKYEMPLLQQLALEKFEKDADMLEWDDEAFCSAVATTFALTMPNDQGLRPLVVQVLHSRVACHQSTTANEEQIRRLPELAYSLWLYGLEASKGPQCSICTNTKVRKCRGRNHNDNSWGDYTRCDNYLAVCDCCPNDSKCGSCSRGDSPEHVTVEEKMMKKKKLRGSMTST